jgi:hypothetical protein
METIKTTLSSTFNNVKTSISKLTFRSVIAFLICALIIYGLISFLRWLFTGSSSSQAPVCPENDESVKVYNKPEVFNVVESAYCFPEAENVCKKYNARLASKSQLDDAQKKGANWCNLGWLTAQEAYYPTQSEQITIAEKWPKQLQNACGQVGLNGGSYPAQLKLSVNCYGIKPADLVNINPWNTITQKWSQYS